MSDLQEKNKKVIREFFLTNIALNNKISVYLAAVVLIFAGMLAYSRLPKELFPEIVIPTVYVQTIYPGNPPVDMENLVTRPVEKELESIKGVKKITSTSSQDVSTVIIEFNTNIFCNNTHHCSAVKRGVIANITSKHKINNVAC